MQYKKRCTGTRRYSAKKNVVFKDNDKTSDNGKMTKKMSFEKRTFLQSVISVVILLYCIGVSYSNTAVRQKEFIANNVNITANKKDVIGYLGMLKKISLKGINFAQNGVERLADLCTPKTQDDGDKSLTALAMKDDKSNKSDADKDTAASDSKQKTEIADDYANTLTVPIKGKITSAFGDRIHPVSGESSTHMGVDISADYGTCVTACKKGFVSEAGYDGNLGNYVKVDHGDGIVTVYGHLSEISVKPNEYVDKSIKIGSVGQTGVATGPHLHLEVRVNGKCQDPADYVEGISYE